jgi:hypothetical protein
MTTLRNEFKINRLQEELKKLKEENNRLRVAVKVVQNSIENNSQLSKYEKDKFIRLSVFALTYKNDNS